MRAVADYKKPAEECRQLADGQAGGLAAFSGDGRDLGNVAKHREIDLEWEKRRAADSSTVTP